MAVWTGGGSSGSGTGAEAVARGCAELLCGEGFREETDGRENKLRDEVSSAGMRLPKLGWLFKGDKTFPFMVFFGRQQRTGRLGLRA